MGGAREIDDLGKMGVVEDWSVRWVDRLVESEKKDKGGEPRPKRKKRGEGDERGGSGPSAEERVLLCYVGAPAGRRSIQDGVGSAS